MLVQAFQSPDQQSLRRAAGVQPPPGPGACAAQEAQGHLVRAGVGGGSWAMLGAAMDTPWGTPSIMARTAGTLPCSQERILLILLDYFGVPSRSSFCGDLCVGIKHT